MTEYRRTKAEGATYFFTVNCAERRGNHLLVEHNWEHLIRDDRRHVDYIHWNPVKHGWVNRVRDWPRSSFHAYVRRGIVSADWAGELDDNLEVGE